MKIFKIDSIEYGWFGIFFGKYYIECSDYLDYDSPKRLLEAVADLVEKKAREKWICFHNEPGASIMQIVLEENKLIFQLFDSVKTSWELKNSDDLPQNSCDKCLWSMNFDIPLIVDNLVTEFSLYENGNGLSMYEKHWMEYPKKEYTRLKEYAIKLQEQMSENNELFGMFCTTY